MPHQEQLKYTVENHKPFADLYAKYQEVATKAEKPLVLPLPYSQKPIKAPVKEALKRLAAQDQDKHLHARAAFEVVTSLRTSLQEEKRKIMKRYNEAKQSEKGKAVAGVTLALMAQDLLQQ